MKNTDQQFNQIFANYIKNFERTPISDEMRRLLPIVIFSIQGVTEQLPEYVKDAVVHEVPDEKILEAIYQLEPITGIGKVRAALKAIHQVISVDNFSQKQDDPQFGIQVQQKIYGTEIRDLLADLPDGAGNFIADHLTNHFFGDFYQHEALTVKERELLELVSFITLNVDFQINAHAIGSLKAGNSESEIVWTIINMLPYVGFSLVINSIQKVHAAAEKLAQMR